MANAIDREIDYLLDQYADAADRIADYMAQLTLENDPNKQQAIYMLIVALLLRLQELTREWSEEAISDAYQDAAFVAQDLLREAGIEEPILWSPADEYEMEMMMSAFDEEMRQAIAGIQANAQRAKRGTSLGIFAVGLGVGAIAQARMDRLSPAMIAKIQATLRERFREGVISILGKNGRYYNFSLDYYGQMVATRVRYETMTRATMQACQQNGWDLVMVSPNPSTIGDYCDEYRGKVFSLSGQSPVYPSVSMLPGGTAPMHPHCRHYLIPFTGMETGLSEEGLDPDFMQLSVNGETNPNVYQTLWRAKQAAR